MARHPYGPGSEASNEPMRQSDSAQPGINSAPTESPLPKDCPLHSGCVVELAGVKLSMRPHQPSPVIAVEGEIDASNSNQLAEGMNHLSLRRSPLVLDLAGVTFMSGAAFRALLAFGENRDRAGLPWALVSGAGLRPLLRVFADHRLPVVQSVAAATQHIESNAPESRDLLESRSR